MVGTPDYDNTQILKTDTAKDDIQPDDATWNLTSAFIIFTMQSGFGLLEAGMVSAKNESNIMVKNAIDVIFGGLAYWMFGFAISFGNGETSNWFTAWEYFFVDSGDHNMSPYAKYFFQLSFAKATTIVSGAMAERVEIKAYIALSFFNTLSYAFPAHWMLDDTGFLKRMGAVDVAGCGHVHLVGGVAAIVAAVMLGPRKNKFDEHGKPNQTTMASPTNVLLGTFMLWWGWLGFNCRSTFETSGDKWKIASRSAVVTINSSIGGGIFGIMYIYFLFKKKLLINIFVTGILGGLVSVTAICAVSHPWEALIIGIIGGAVATLGIVMEERFQIDDPVSAFPTHALASVWGLVAVALFGEKTAKFSEHSGVLKGGPWKFFGVQILAVVMCTAWAAFTTFLQLFIISKLIGLRMSEEEEELGADYYVHDIDTREDASLNDEVVISEHPGRNGEQQNFERRNKSRVFGLVRMPKLSRQRKFEMKAISDVDVSTFWEINPHQLSAKFETSISNSDVIPSFKIDSPPKDTFDKHGVVPEGKRNGGFHSA